MVVKQITEPGQQMAFETSNTIIPLASIAFVRLPERAVVVYTGDTFTFNNNAEWEAFLAWYRRVVAVTHA